MWGLVAELGIEVALWAANKWLTPDGKRPVPHLDTVNLPRTQEGTPVPLVYGRCRVNAPILAYTSKLSSVTVDNGNNGASYVAYGFDMLFVAGLPMGTAGVTHFHATDPLAPRLWNVWMGDRKIAPPVLGALPGMGTTIFRSQQVFKPHLFGGPGAGGGMMGAYQWFGGYTDQDFNSPPSPIGDSLTANAPGLVPGLRRMMCVGFTTWPKDSSSPYWNETGPDGEAGGGTTEAAPHPDGFNLGENPQVDGLSFEVTSFGDALFSMTNPGFDFGGDADPVEVIYDILTNKWGRIGLDTTKIDLASFAAASATLKAEDHGFSLAFYDRQSGKDMLKAVLNQINAALYEEPTTGLVVIKLIRADYVVSALPAFNEDNIIDVNSLTVGSMKDAVSEVRVTYSERLNDYQPATALARSPAIATTNATRRQTREVSYPGCCNGTLGHTLAERDLNALSQPLAKMQVTVNRDGFDLRPGSVFTISYAEYGLSSRIFRVTKIDLGQLFDNKIVVDAIEDFFASSYGGLGTGDGYHIIEAPIPYPFASRIVTEAPRWLAMQSFNSGLVADPDVSHLMPLLVAPTNATQYMMKTRRSGAQANHGVLSFDWLVDVPAIPFPTTFTVATSYARELEPYDTTTGLVIENLVLRAGLLALTAATPTQIRTFGSNLIALVTPAGAMEVIAFESATFLGAGQWRFNNVWRGLLDTPPIAIPVGTRGWFIDGNLVGRRGWATSTPIELQLLPVDSVGFGATGSGGDPIDTYVAAGLQLSNSGGLAGGRGLLPLQVADFAVVGEGSKGTLGLPSIAGHLKGLSLLEEGFDLYGDFRLRLVAALRRGNDGVDTGQTSANGVVASATVAGLPFNPIGITDNNLRVYTDSSDVVSGALHGCLKVDAFGSVDLVAAAFDQVAAGDPRIGKGGVSLGDILYGWTPPRVTAYAAPWRNLLVNTRWNYQITGPDAQAWDNNVANTGTPALPSGATSLSRAASGPGSYILTAASATMVRAQTCYVTKWKPRGLQAYVVGYFRNTNADANDTGSLTVRARDLIGSPLTSAIAGPTAFITTAWTRIFQLLTLPANTARVSAEIALAEVAGGGTGNADVAATEIELRVGQFQANALTNYSFETGPGIGSWTLDSGAITAAALIASPSPNYAICSGAANAQMHQDFALPAGWEYGCQAFVTCFRASRIGGLNRGTVTIQALDVANNVLASGTTGAETLAPLDIWYKRTIFCDVPETSTKVRVIVSGTYAAGANVGEAIDEVVLWISKDMAPRYTRTFDFSAPTIQATPTTWQEYVLAYRANPAPDHVFNGLDFGQEEMAWTDAATTSGHATGKLVGQFGAGVTSINAYSFARGTGAAATHIAATHQGRRLLANFKLTDPFSVMVDFRVDEPGFATACGLVGRMDLTAGWGISISAGGQLTALLRGAGATTKTVATGRVCTEGAYRKAVLVNDPVAQLLWIYDETGGVSVSTAAGLGAIDRVADTCHLRIGRDADDHDVLPGMIARVYVWSVALTSGQVAAHMTYGDDPTGLITTYTRTAAAVVQMKDDDAGATLAVMATTQVALGYSPTNILDGGSGYGIAVGRPTANKVPSFDFSNGAVWAPGPGVSLTRGIVDPTGRPRGVTVSGTAPNGVTCTGLPLAAVASTIGLSFFARINFGGATTLKINLRNFSGTLINSTTVTLTALWKRFDVLLSWNGSSATANIEFVSNAGAMTFDLAGIVHCWIEDGTNSSFPALIPAAAASSLAAYNFSRTETLPIQFNGEGEIVLTGATMLDLPLSGSFVSVRNGSNNKNRRELQYFAGTGSLRQAHWDGVAVPVVVNSDVSYTTTQSLLFTARSRWQRIGLTDVTAGRFAQVAVSDTSSPSPTEGGAGRTGTWTNDTTPSTIIEVGTGNAGPCDDAILRTITLQARESKFD